MTNKKILPLMAVMIPALLFMVAIAIPEDAGVLVITDPTDPSHFITVKKNEGIVQINEHHVYDTSIGMYKYSSTASEGFTGYMTMSDDNDDLNYQEGTGWITDSEFGRAGLSFTGADHSFFFCFDTGINVKIVDTRNLHVETFQEAETMEFGEYCALEVYNIVGSGDGGDSNTAREDSLSYNTGISLEPDLTAQDGNTLYKESASISSDYLDEWAELRGDTENWLSFRFFAGEGCDNGDYIDFCDTQGGSNLQPGLWFYYEIDEDPPVVSEFNFPSSLKVNMDLQVEINVSDDNTAVSDISVVMNYGFQDIDSLPYSVNSVCVDDIHYIIIDGKRTACVVWFEIVITDECANSITLSPNFSEWTEFADSGDDGGSTGVTDDGNDALIVIFFFFSLACVGLVTLLLSKK